jgi:hypothetical protein
MTQATEGNRHNTLITEAMNIASLVKANELPPESLSELEAAAATVDWPDKGRNEIDDAITYAYKHAEPQPHPTGQPYAPPNPYTLPTTPPTTPTPNPDNDPTQDPRYIQPTNLTEVSTGTYADEQWLIEPIIPAQRQAALYAQGKTGKSLLALDIAAAAATGKPILGNHTLPKPIRTLYVDKEMTKGDLQERLHKLGHHHNNQPHWDTLEQNLIYYQHKFPYHLDTAEGGNVLLYNAHYWKVDLVIVDTLIRLVKGEENSADMIKDFNLHTGQRLKEAGIALLRVDHAGKDASRGQRGTSAKLDDVDLVWKLKPSRLKGLNPDETILELIREAARTDWIPEQLHITRHQGPPLRHTIPEQTALTPADITLVNYVQKQGLWRNNVTVANFLETVRAGGHKCGSGRGNDIVKWMHKFGDPKPGKTTESGGISRGVAESSQGEYGEERETETGNAQVRQGNAEGNAQKQKSPRTGNSPPPYEIRGGNAHATPKPEEQDPDQLPDPY